MNIEIMKQAIDIAKTSQIDVPVGAIIVCNNEIIASAVNERERTQSTIRHAELIAIEIANKKLGNWRLTNCEIYVTLEPCPMCAGAILQSRMKSVYFGAYDMLNGALGSKFDMQKVLGIFPQIIGGILEEECSELLKNYFIRIR